MNKRMCLISSFALLTVCGGVLQWPVAVELIETNLDREPTVCQVITSPQSTLLCELTHTHTRLASQHSFLNFPLNCHLFEVAMEATHHPHLT